jgi:cell wall assembly regulator SMI1
MTLLEIVKSVLAKPDGNDVILHLTPGLTEAEIAAFEAGLPCPLPPDIRDLLAFTTGFAAGLADTVDFTGRSCSFEFEPAFPHGLPIASDGYGNFWVVDLMPESKAWAPIYFACHDPPIILFQSPSFEHFLAELFKCETPACSSAIDDVHDDRLYRVWRKNPGVLSYGQCLNSPDAELAAFSRELGRSFEFIDLRNAKIGFGFSWGRYGADTVVKRFGSVPIFGYKRK